MSLLLKKLRVSIDIFEPTSEKEYDDILEEWERKTRALSMDYNLLNGVVVVLASESKKNCNPEMYSWKSGLISKIVRH